MRCDNQSQPWSSECAQAPHGVVVATLDVAQAPLDLGAGLVSQSAATVAILLPGLACGMPCAPELSLCALAFQWLSRVQSLSRHGNWSILKSVRDHQRAADLAVAGELVARGRDRTVVGLGLDAAPWPLRASCGWPPRPGSPARLRPSRPPGRAAARPPRPRGARPSLTRGRGDAPSAARFRPAQTPRRTAHRSPAPGPSGLGPGSSRHPPPRRGCRPPTPNPYRLHSRVTKSFPSSGTRNRRVVAGSAFARQTPLRTVSREGNREAIV